MQDKENRQKKRNREEKKKENTSKKRKYYNINSQEKSIAPESRVSCPQPERDSLTHSLTEDRIPEEQDPGLHIRVAHACGAWYTLNLRWA